MQEGTGQGGRGRVKGPRQTVHCVTHIPSPMLLITGERSVSPAGEVDGHSRFPWHPVPSSFFPPTCARLPCPSLYPRVYSNSCPWSRSCHPTISSSVVPFSSCSQSFPASGFSSSHQVAKLLELQLQHANLQPRVVLIFLVACVSKLFVLYWGIVS